MSWRASYARIKSFNRWRCILKVRLDLLKKREILSLIVMAAMTTFKLNMEIAEICGDRDVRRLYLFAICNVPASKFYFLVPKERNVSISLFFAVMTRMILEIAVLKKVRARLGTHREISYLGERHRRVIVYTPRR